MFTKVASVLLIIILFAGIAVTAGAEASPPDTDDELTNASVREQIHSEAAVLIDGDTGQVIFEKNMNKKLEPASITKIMTGLLALELSELSDVLTLSREAVFTIEYGSSHIALDPDEQITMEQALYALAIESANDASNGIAEHIGGDMESFSRLMTERAKEAGALNTNFTNAHGLHDPEHYTTAYDMAMITMAAIHTPGFTKIFGTEKYTVPPTNMKTEPRYFWSRNAMITGRFENEGVIMGKTGWTPEAGHTLVTAAQKNGRTLIAVVMNSSSRDDKYRDTTLLFKYGFNNFTDIIFEADELDMLLSESDKVAQHYTTYNDDDGSTTEVSFYAEEDFKCLLPNEYTKDYIEVGFISENDLKIVAIFTLKAPTPSPYYKKLGEMVLSDEVVIIEDDAFAADHSFEPDYGKGRSVIATVALWVFGVIAFLFLVIMILRLRNYIIRQRRRKKRYNDYRKYRRL